MPAMERVTVTLPTALVEQIDRLGSSRSRFIVEAVEHELGRQCRNSLRLSVQNPHPETAAFADTELSAWTSDLLGGETLVDASGGTAVRWIKGPRLDQGIAPSLSSVPGSHDRAPTPFRVTLRVTLTQGGNITLSSTAGVTQERRSGRWPETSCSP